MAGEKGSILPQIVAAVGATLGAFSLGTVISWPAITQPYLDESKCGDPNIINGDTGEPFPHECDITLTSSEFSQVAALMNIGAAIVPLFAVFSMPIIGKKWTMIALSVPFIAGWVLILIANDVGLFYAGRLLTGFSGGCFALAAPAYTNDIAETRIKGALGSMMQLMTTSGILFVQVFGTVLDWQVLTGISIAFPSLLAIWMFFMPRSPVFLVEKGKIQEAEKSLQFLRKKKDVKDELEQIQAEVTERSKLGSVSPLALVTKPQYVKPFAIAAMIMLFQQLSGINFVMNYTVAIFDSAGSDMDPNLSTIILGIIQVAGTVVAILIVDRFGRKLLLGISALFMGISLLALGVYFNLKENADSESTGNMTSTTTTAAYDAHVSAQTVEDIGILPLISLMMFIASFSVGFGPLPWVMNVELSPAESRSTAASACTAINWLTSYIVVSFTHNVEEATSQSVCYFLFSGACFIGFLFILFITPETKGKTEEDMRRYFSGKK